MEKNKQYKIPVSYGSIKKKKKKRNSICKEGQVKKAKQNHNLPTSCPRLILNSYCSKTLVFL